MCSLTPDVIAQVFFVFKFYLAFYAPTLVQQLLLVATDWSDIILKHVEPIDFPAFAAVYSVAWEIISKIKEFHSLLFIHLATSSL